MKTLGEIDKSGKLVAIYHSTDNGATKVSHKPGEPCGYCVNQLGSLSKLDGQNRTSDKPKSPSN